MNKTLVLTGASSGIGEAAALQFGARGARLCLVARRAEELERVAHAVRRVGGQARVFPADLSQPESVAALAERLLAECPDVDVLINNAGRSIRRPILETRDRLHDYQRTMQVNYFGAVQLTLALLPRLLARRGQVVMSSTLSAQIPIPLFAAYLASKAALDSFARSLAAEHGSDGLAVSTVYFPMVRTAMSSRTAIYRHMPMISAEAAAGLLVQAVATRRRRVGQPLGTLGELALAALPGPVTRHTQPLFRAMDRWLARRAGMSDR